MTDVSGAWDVTVRGMGQEQTVRATLTQSGSEVTGEIVDGDQRYPVTGGSIDGDQLSFAMSITEPMRAKLTAKLTVDGDRMSGAARANLILKVDVTAVRVS